jgi:hypothetical protein
MHLDLSGLWRRRQAAAIISHLTSCIDRHPTVMMGDLNEWTRAAAVCATLRGTSPWPIRGPAFMPGGRSGGWTGSWYRPNCASPIAAFMHGHLAQGIGSSAHLGDDRTALMREKELRLALVCYGGISLAVYMHGITKEIWRVVRASRASHEGDEPASAVDAVYHDLLDEMAARGGVRVRILADIIAGASAGGSTASSWGRRWRPASRSIR